MESSGDTTVMSNDTGDAASRVGVCAPAEVFEHEKEGDEDDLSELPSDDADDSGEAHASGGGVDGSSMYSAGALGSVACSVGIGIARVGTWVAWRRSCAGREM
jgi:hypothetical protein